MPYNYNLEHRFCLLPMMPRVFEHLHTFIQLWKHPRADRKSIVRFQNRKLRSIISYAYKNLPYYRQLFDRYGISPDDIKTVDDISIIPITSSQDFRNRPVEETISQEAKLHRMVQRHTSGSTGRPFTIRRTPLEDHLINSFRIRSHRRFGVRIKDVRASIEFTSQSHRRDNLLGAIRQFLGIYRVYSINCLGSAADIASELEEIGPDIISGFPEILSHVAQYLTKEDRTIHPRFVITGGESLTPFRKQKIENGFKCKAFDIYGSHEFNVLAWACPDTGQYHVCDDNVIVEVLRNGRQAKPGERGEVVATGLNCYAMPFIRYRLGDVVTQGTNICSCGQPFSTIRHIQGRMHDYFIMPDGSLLHPDNIIVPVMENESSWIDQYQILQEKEDRVVLRIHPFHSPDETQLRHVKQLARAQLPSSVKFSIDIVDNLAFETSGKFRFCRSLVNSKCDDIDWENLA